MLWAKSLHIAVIASWFTGLFCRPPIFAGQVFAALAVLATVPLVVVKPF